MIDKVDPGGKAPGPPAAFTIRRRSRHSPFTIPAASRPPPLRLYNNPLKWADTQVCPYWERRNAGKLFDTQAA